MIIYKIILIIISSLMNMHQGHHLLQIQASVMEQTSPEEFVEQLFIKDTTVLNKFVENCKKLMSFSLGNLINILKILEEKSLVELDKDKKDIYEKYIIPTKWTILGYSKSEVANSILDKQGLKFSRIIQGYDFGHLIGFDGKGKKRVIDFEDIKLSELEEIYKEIEHGDSVTGGVSKNVDGINERLKAIAFHVKGLGTNLSGIDSDSMGNINTQEQLLVLLGSISSMVAKTRENIKFSLEYDNMR